MRRSHVHFVGRLATYRYYNMDQVVAQALTTFRKIADASSSIPLTTAYTLDKKVLPSISPGALSTSTAASNPQQ